MSTVTVSIRMTPELKRRLEVAAEARVVSRSLLACKAIEYYLDEIPDLDEQLRTLRASATYDPPNWWERIAVARKMREWRRSL